MKKSPRQDIDIATSRYKHRLTSVCAYMYKRVYTIKPSTSSAKLPSSPVTARASEVEGFYYEPLNFDVKPSTSSYHTFSCDNKCPSPLHPCGSAVVISQTLSKWGGLSKKIVHDPRGQPKLPSTDSDWDYDSSLNRQHF